MRISFEEFVEQFSWESEEQKKGFLALAKDLKDKHLEVMRSMDDVSKIEYALQVACCWFMQKDHESNEWYNERIGDLDKKHTDIEAELLQNQRELQNEVAELKRLIEEKTTGG